MVLLSDGATCRRNTHLPIRGCTATRVRTLRHVDLLPPRSAGQRVPQRRIELSLQQQQQQQRRQQQPQQLVPPPAVPPALRGPAAYCPRQCCDSRPQLRRSSAKLLATLRIGRRVGGGGGRGRRRSRVALDCCSSSGPCRITTPAAAIRFFFFAARRILRSSRLTCFAFC